MKKVYVKVRECVKCVSKILTKYRIPNERCVWRNLQRIEHDICTNNSHWIFGRTIRKFIYCKHFFPQKFDRTSSFRYYWHIRSIGVNIYTKHFRNHRDQSQCIHQIYRIQLSKFFTRHTNTSNRSRILKSINMKSYILSL